MCFDYDGIENEFCTSEFRKAAKQHTCECCGRSILVGQQYEYTSGKCEGDLFVIKTCNLCVQDRFKIVAEELREGCSWYEAWPYNGDDQSQWIFYHDDFKEAKNIRDLKECRHELDEFHKKLKAKV